MHDSARTTHVKTVVHGAGATLTVVGTPSEPLGTPAATLGMAS